MMSVASFSGARRLGVTEVGPLKRRAGGGTGQVLPQVSFTASLSSSFALKTTQYTNITHIERL